MKNVAPNRNPKSLLCCVRRIKSDVVRSTNQHGWDILKTLFLLQTLGFPLGKHEKCGPKQKSQDGSYNFVRILHKVYFVSWFVIFKLSIPSSRNIAPLLIK